MKSAAERIATTRELVPVNGAPLLVRPDLARICAALPGKYRRIPTGCAPLDERTGGGLQTGRLVIVGGAPGATKTGLVLSIAHNIASAGRALVHVVAADEPRDGLLSRLGQIEGASRAALESDDATIAGSAWDFVAARLGAIPDLTVWDAHDDGASVEQIASFARREAQDAGRLLVLVVDSLQAAPFDADRIAGDSPRERMDGRVDVLRALRDRSTCVVAISELNRLAYGHASTGPGLASFKESSAIEYRADLPLTLHRVKDEDGVIEVTPQKNRLGPSLEPFRLRRLAGCTFEPLEMPSDETRAADRAARDTARRDGLRQAIEAAVLANADVRSVAELRSLVSGGGSEAKGAAIAAMRREGRLTGGNGRPFRVVPLSSTASRANEWGGDD